jgi:hypothetical protein
MAKLPEKVVKLFLIWATSDKPGEASNAKDLFDRELKKADLDMHSIAEMLLNGGDGQYTEEQMIEAYRRGREEERQQSIDTHSEPNWHKIARECAANSRVFRGDKEKEFITDMVRLTECGIELSEKRRTWLADIYSRIR